MTIIQEGDGQEDVVLRDNYSIVGITASWCRGLGFTGPLALSKERGWWMVCTGGRYGPFPQTSNREP